MEHELDFRKNPVILGNIVDSLEEGVFSMDHEGVFISWSIGAERILGYTSLDVLGKPFSIFENKKTENRGDFSSLFDDPSEIKQGFTSKQWVVLAKNGREVLLSIKVRFLFHSDQSFMGLLGIFTPIPFHSMVQNSDQQVSIHPSLDISPVSSIVGETMVMKEIIRKIELASQSDVTVLITGESGTGKELVAKAIHSLSSREEKSFLAVNCSAIPDTLLESELFGHVKGSFTGAYKDKEGIFHQAEGGTLFLDEIGDVSQLIQVKLLRALQEKEIRRVGDDKGSQTNIRLITATNKRLKELMAFGTFRQDFYYRIRVFEIKIPPLRERKEDIPLLIHHFMEELSQSQKKKVTGISPQALERCVQYPWPGNIRELKNAMEHAFVTVESEMISLLDLPFEIYSSKVTESFSIPTIKTIDHFSDEKNEIIFALKQAKGKLIQASKILGYSRVTLWKKLRRFNINVKEIIK